MYSSWKSETLTKQNISKKLKNYSNGKCESLQNITYGSS